MYNVSETIVYRCTTIPLEADFSQMVNGKDKNSSAAGSIPSIHLLPTHVLERPFKHLFALHDVLGLIVLEQVTQLARLGMDLAQRVKVGCLELKDL